MAFGLTENGFVIKRQQDIITEIQASLQAAFGQAVNLLPESVFGQLVSIFSEREALIWELAEAVYDSQYPSGAEGPSVDNILALNNLRRLAAAASTSELTLRGTAGTFIPAGSLVSVLGTPTSQFATDEDATIAAAVNEIQSLAFTANPTAGVFALSIDDSEDETLTTSNIGFCSPAGTTTVLKGAVAPTAGQYKITVNGLSTGFLQYSDGAATIQTAIRLLSGYGSVTVAGASFTAGYTITWTGVSTSIGRIASLTTNTLDQTIVAGNGIQDILRCLTKIDLTTPYNDVTVSGNFTTGFTVTFGGATSGEQPQNTMVVQSNTLLSGATAVNITVIESQKGAYAEVLVGSTCTETGATFASAGNLSVIDTPVSGWDSVTNAEDAVVGRDVETDTAALQRRISLLASNASGPLQAIVQQVASLDNVSSAVGFENLSRDTDYSSVLLSFSATPEVGSYKLLLGGPFGDLTATIDWDATAGEIQTAIQGIGSPYEDVTVSGTAEDGFFIFFGGDFVSQDPPTSDSNTLLNDGDPVTISLTGRPGKSFEIVVEGGDQDEIGNAIWSSKPAGIETYGGVGPIIIQDDFGQSYSIYFSRPSEVPIYMNIVLNVDQSLFPLDGVQQIQEEIVTIGDALDIGDTVITYGSDGLIGAFNGVPGIISYTMAVGITNSPTLDDNIDMQPQQIATFDTSRIIVTVNYV